MSQNHENKVKVAFENIKKDISNLNSNMKHIILQKEMFQNQMRNEKKQRHQEINELKNIINKDFEKTTISFQHDNKITNNLVKKTEKSLKNRINNQQQKSNESIENIHKSINTLDKDLQTTTKNIQNINSRTNSLEKTRTTQNKNLKEIKQNHKNLLNNSKKVTDLKKNLMKSINYIHLNKIEIKEIKNKIVKNKKEENQKLTDLNKLIETHKINLNNDLKILEDYFKTELEKTNQLSKSKIKELNIATGKFNDVLIKTKELADKNKTENTDLKNQNKKLMATNSKLTTQATEFEKRIKSLESFENKLNKTLKKIKQKSSQKSPLSKTKNFLFDLFFEEIETKEPALKEIKNK